MLTINSFEQRHRRRVVDLSNVPIVQTNISTSDNKSIAFGFTNKEVKSRYVLKT
jgi:hypothetical protein